MKNNKFIRINKGLDLPITGEIVDFDAVSKSVNEVAVVGPDFVGMKPSIKVRVGDTVKAGQVLFSCKKNEGLQTKIDKHLDSNLLKEILAVTLIVRYVIFLLLKNNHHTFF